jgi:hypothetical protein
LIQQPKPTLPKRSKRNLATTTPEFGLKNDKNFALTGVLPTICEVFENSQQFEQNLKTLVFRQGCHVLLVNHRRHYLQAEDLGNGAATLGYYDQEAV